MSNDQVYINVPQYDDLDGEVNLLASLHFLIDRARKDDRVTAEGAARITAWLSSKYSHEASQSS